MKVPPHRLAPTIALLVSSFVTAMNLSSTSTAMPTIVGDLGGLSLYSWTFSAYLLTSTTGAPIFGKLADLYGRKPLFLVGVGMFVLGSLLCGLATSMEQLIVCRAVQGVGAAGIYPIANTIAGDLFTFKERARIAGVMSSVWAMGGITGPIIGSLIVSQTTWRWVFWVNVPISLFMALVLALSLREHVVARRHQIDYLGAGLLTAGITGLLFALVHGGQTSLASPEVLGLAAGSVLVLALFLWVEARAPEPVVPLELLRQRLLGLISLGGCLIGACMFANSTYLPLFVQGAQGRPPRDVAIVSGSMTVCWAIGAFAGGQVLVRCNLRAAALFGMGLTSVGAALQTGFTLDTPLWGIVATGILLALGLGAVSTAFIVAVQTAVAWEQRGTATSGQQFFRSIGGMLWVSVQGAALSAATASALASVDSALQTDAPSRLGRLSALLDPSVRAALPPEQARALAEALGAGLHQVFLLYLGAALVGLLVAAFLPSGAVTEPASAAPRERAA